MNPMVMVYALDGPDVMEAVALDWEKVGIKSKRVPEAISTFGPKARHRKTDRRSGPTARPLRRAHARLERILHSKGSFNLLARAVRRGHRVRHDGVQRERRTKMTRDLGQKLYDDYRGVMLGVKSISWAMSKKVSAWQSLAYIPLETNYEYIS